MADRFFGFPLRMNLLQFSAVSRGCPGLGNLLDWLAESSRERLGLRVRLCWHKKDRA